MGLIGCTETSVKITTTSCVIAQKSVVLTYVAVEAWKHVRYLWILSGSEFPFAGR